MSFVCRSSGCNHVAHCLSAHLRNADLLARFGGEEFAVLLPDTSIDDAMQTAERLRQAVETLVFLAGGQQANVTISVGVAAREGVDTQQALIGAADTALYAAKHAGRNRVRVANSSAEPWGQLSA